MPSHDGGVAPETSLPEVVAEQHHLARAGPGVLRLYPAAEQRPDAERVVGAGAHRERGGAERITLSEDRRLADAVGAERVERILQPREIHVIAEGVERLGDAGALVAVVEGDETVGLGVGQRTEQHRLHHGEHGHVGADAEREREDGGEGEPGLAGEPADGVAEVVEEHRRLPRDGWSCWWDGGEGRYRLDAVTGESVSALENQYPMGDVQ